MERNRRLILMLLILCCVFGYLGQVKGESGLLDEIKRVTHVLKPGKEAHINDPEKLEFQQFCRIGDKKFMIYYFRTATLRIISAAEDIKLIKGYSPKDVYYQYKHSVNWFFWMANVLPWRARDTNFPTFNTSCVGIMTKGPYTASMIVKPVDPWKVLTLAAGLTMFFMAPKFAKSTVFFYTSGTLLGGLAAALVFLFVVMRVLPKSKSGYFTMTVLWSMMFYFAGEMWKRFQEMLHEQLPYVVAYLVSGAVISFLACYRWGPPQHPKTLDIIRWALQVFGLILIHFSSDFIEMSTAIILIVFVYQNTETFWSYYLRKLYLRLFPPPRHLLTEEEYITQGAVETQRGLEELKKFCSSPDAKPWKIVSRLKDPKRFSSFIEGESSHIDDDAILAYEDDKEMYPHKISPRLTRLSLTNNASFQDNSEMLTDDSDSELVDDTSIHTRSRSRYNNSQNQMETTDDEA